MASTTVTMTLGQHLDAALEGLDGLSSTQLYVLTNSIMVAASFLILKDNVPQNRRGIQRNKANADTMIYTDEYENDRKVSYSGSWDTPTRDTENPQPIPCGKNIPMRIFAEQPIRGERDIFLQFRNG